MKKIVTAGVLSSALLVSGCTFNDIKEKIGLTTPAISQSTAEIEKTQNPEKLFFDFAKESGKVGLKTLGLSDFDTELFKKSQSKIAINGDFNMEGVPMINGGTGTFALNIDSINDYSDSTNPLLSETIKTKFNALGGLIKGNISTELRIVNSSIFAQIKALDVNFPGLTPQISTIIQKFIGTWYGNSFQEINALAEKELQLQGFDIKTLLTGTIRPITDGIALIQDIGNNPKNYLTFNKFVKEEDGYYFFEVTPKKDIYKKVSDIIITYLTNNGVAVDTQTANAIKQIKEKVETLPLHSVIIGYTPENPEYFKISQDFKIGNNSDTNENHYTFTANNTKSGLVITLTQPKGEHPGSLTFTKTANGEISVISEDLTQDDKKLQFISGTWTDKKHEFTLSLPSYNNSGEENLEDILHGSFTKTEDTWSGELTSPKVKEGKIRITDTKGDAHHAHTKISVMYNDKTIINVVFDANSTKPENVTIETPTNVQSFDTLPTRIENEMNTLYNSPSSPAIQSIQDDNTASQKNNTNTKNEVKTQNTEIKTENKTQEIKVNNVHIKTTKDKVDVNAQGGADYSEISGKLARMAQLMNENPNNEAAKAEYTKLAQEVKEYADETGIAKETLRELLMKEVKKQVK